MSSEYKEVKSQRPYEDIGADPSVRQKIALAIIFLGIYKRLSPRPRLRRAGNLPFHGRIQNRTYISIKLISFEIKYHCSKLYS